MRFEYKTTSNSHFKNESVCITRCGCTVTTIAQIMDSEVISDLRTLCLSVYIVYNNRSHVFLHMFNVCICRVDGYNIVIWRGLCRSREVGASRCAAVRALGGAHVRRVRAAQAPAARHRPRAAGPHRGQLGAGTLTLLVPVYIPSVKALFHTVYVLLSN